MKKVVSKPNQVATPVVQLKTSFDPKNYAKGHVTEADVLFAK
jgi:hypothetical protein